MSKSNVRVLVACASRTVTLGKVERLLETINREKNVHVPRLRSPEAYVW